MSAPADYSLFDTTQTHRRTRTRIDLHDSASDTEQYKRQRHDSTQNGSNELLRLLQRNNSNGSRQSNNDVKTEIDDTEYTLPPTNTSTYNTDTSNITDSSVHTDTHSVHSHLDNNHSELECVVCLSLPDTEILQCENGHLLCKQCWRKVTDSQRSICPVCKAKLNRDKPHRNRFAESCLAKLLMSCTNTGCTQKIQFSQLQPHITEQCIYRIVQCKYEPLGCTWSDKYTEYKQHIKQCTIKSLNIKQILHNVTTLNHKYIEQQQKHSHTVESQIQLGKILRKRCRNMEVRDVIIERDGLDNNIRCSKIFKALGMTWEAYITAQHTNHTITSIKIHFKVISVIRRKQTVELFVLNGPALDIQLNPTLRRVIFRKKVKLCEPFPLPCTPTEAQQIYNMDSVSLRIGFLDVSAGRVKSSFTTLNRSVHDDSDSDDSSDDSVCEHEIVHLPYNTMHPDDISDSEDQSENDSTDISENSDVVEIDDEYDSESVETDNSDTHNIVYETDSSDDTPPSSVTYSDIDDANRE